MEVEELIKKHEGFRKNMYQCSQGFNTIGYGLNLDAGISTGLAEAILQYQVSVVKTQCMDNFPWFSELDEVRQAVVLDMVYNLGLNGFMKFRKTIRLIEIGMYLEAGEEMLDSLWARQVGSRAIRLYEMMQTGVYNE